MYVIKKINIKRFARLFGMLSACLSLVPAVFGGGGILISLMFLNNSMFSIFTFAPLVWLLIMPLVSYLLGCVFGSIFGYAYNALAERGYGLEMDIEKLPEANQ